VHVQPPLQPPPPAGKAYKKMRSAEYTHEAASGATKPALNPCSAASDIPLAQLKISADQLAALQRMYDPNAGASAGALPVDHIFKLDADDQLYAAAIMAQHGLDLEAREHLTNRWSQQWARSGGGKKTSKDVSETRKILYLW
ncbi:hypothetical protein DFH07DRAFT_695064, partial [Mycena maculata]